MAKTTTACRAATRATQLQQVPPVGALIVQLDAVRGRPRATARAAAPPRPRTSRPRSPGTPAAVGLGAIPRPSATARSRHACTHGPSAHRTWRLGRGLRDARTSARNAPWLPAARACAKAAAWRTSAPASTARGQSQRGPPGRRRAKVGFCSPSPDEDVLPVAPGTTHAIPAQPLIENASRAMSSARGARELLMRVNAAMTAS